MTSGLWCIFMFNRCEENRCYLSAVRFLLKNISLINNSNKIKHGLDTNLWLKLSNLAFKNNNKP